MATTSPRAVKAALKTLLEAKPALSGVTIYTYTEKLERIKTREYVILGNISGGVEPETMGGNTLTSYTIDCEFQIHLPAPDDAADRAWAILDAVAEVLASDWTVNGNVLDTDLATFEIEETVKDDGGLVVLVEFTIDVEDTNG